jgi:type I restriction enzyme, S subunit
MSKYKETEIGLIPTDWNVYSLNKYIKKDRGICYGVVQPGFHDANGIPVIRVNNVRNGRITADDVLKVSPEIEAKYKRSRLEGNEILITLVGNVGEIAIVDPIYKDWNVARAVGVLPIDKSIDRNWLKYWLQSSQVTQYINSHCNTTVQITLNLGDVSNLPILEPSIEEQKRISDILSCLDAKIDNLRRQNETLEEIARSIFKHWFIDFEFPNPDGKPYKSSGGEMVRSDLGDIPECWQVSTIGSEVETVGGGTPSTTEPSYWENGDIAWYSPTDLTRSKTLFSIDSEKKITKTGLQKSSAKLFPKYSLLLTSRATIGEVTISTKDASTNQGFITIIPNEKFSIHFLHGWLLTKIGIIKLLASGSTFPEISKSSFRGLDFLIPLAEVLEKYDLILNPIYKRVENNIFQIQTLTKTRDALLPKLMSGQLRVNE